MSYSYVIIGYKCLNLVLPPCTRVIMSCTICGESAVKFNNFEMYRFVFVANLYNYTRLNIVWYNIFIQYRGRDTVKLHFPYMPSMTMQI